MAISISGRVVKCRLKSELKRVDTRNNMKELVAKYNHFRIQFADGAERHFLFTDKQVQRGVAAAKKRLKKDKPKITWVRELWYDGVMDTKSTDIQKDIQENQLPSIAKRVNHIRVNIEERDIHLLFSDNAVRSALSRSRNVESTLPKVSWLSDEIQEKNQWESMEKPEPKKAPEHGELQTIAN